MSKHDDELRAAQEWYEQQNAPLDMAQQAGQKVKGAFRCDYETTNIVPQQKEKSKLKLITFSNLTYTPTRWLWYPYVVRGAVSIFTATQGTGKSWLCCKLAAAVSNGEQLPNMELHPDYRPFDAVQGDVIYLNAEDEPSGTTLMRLNACGANLERVHYIEAAPDDLLNFYHEGIEEKIKETKAAAIIFDPVQQFFCGLDAFGVPLDMNSANSVRPVMTHLKQIAARNDCAIILICHPNKQLTQTALYRTSGSNDFSAAPRVALFIGRDPEDELTRVIAHTKANEVPDEHQVSLTYKINPKDGGVVFTGNTDLLADDVSNTRRNRKTEGEAVDGRTLKPAPTADKFKDFLDEFLEQHDGIAKRNDIFKRAEYIMLGGEDMKESSRNTYLDRARKSLFINSKSFGHGADKTTYWYNDGAKLPVQIELVGGTGA